MFGTYCINVNFREGYVTFLLAPYPSAKVNEGAGNRMLSSQYVS